MKRIKGKEEEGDEGRNVVGKWLKKQGGMRLREIGVGREEK